MTMTNRRGFVLPSVIFAITIMSIIVIVAVSTATDERRASRGARESTLALYAAEAGLRQTYGAWPSAAVNALNPGDSLDLGWQNLPNKAAYRTVIHRVDKAGLQEYNVVVQGRRTDPTAGITTIVGAVGGVPIFKYAVYTEGDLTLNNGGLFNSYDSDVGAYTSGTADSTANLRANDDISVSWTTVKGDATATGTVGTGFFGYIAGVTTQGATAQTPMDIILCPVTGYTPSALVPAGTGISYNSVSGVLTVSGGNTLTLTDASYFFRAIVLTGNSRIVFPGSPAVNVVLRDSLNAANGIISNSSNKAAALAFSSCGTSATAAPWSLSSSGSSAYYTVYAPNHVVNENGSGDLYGAIVASVYNATGGGRFHYDAALARQSSSKLAVERGSWALLPGS